MQSTRCVPSRLVFGFSIANMGLTGLCILIGASLLFNELRRGFQFSDAVKGYFRMCISFSYGGFFWLCDTHFALAMLAVCTLDAVGMLLLSMGDITGSPIINSIGAYIACEFVAERSGGVGN